VDLNEDGFADILSGCYSDKGKDMAGRFQVLWGTKDGGFRKPVVLDGTDGKPLVIWGGGKNVVRRICTRPFAVDWDGDGDLDIVTGNFEGGFHLFTGEGKGRFSPESKPLTCEKGELRLPRGHVHGDPFVVDWDGDGDLDILSGSASGSIYLAENVAGKGQKPNLKPFEALVRNNQDDWRGAKPQFAAKLPGHPFRAVRIWVGDIDGDGDLDILAGDQVSVSHAAKGIDRETFEKKLAAWEKGMKEVREKLSATKDTTEQRKLQERWSDLYAERSKFVEDEISGFVWLYRRK
jgi:hypothetical protein